MDKEQVKAFALLIGTKVEGVSSQGWAQMKCPLDMRLTGVTDSRYACKNSRIHSVIGPTQGFHVSRVEDHVVPVPQPKGSILPSVWGPRNLGVRAVAGVRELLSRYGCEALCGVVSGPNRQRWELLPGELPLGDPDGAGAKPIAADACLPGDDLGVAGSDKGVASGWLEYPENLRGDRRRKISGVAGGLGGSDL